MSLLPDEAELESGAGDGIGLLDIGYGVGKS